LAISSAKHPLILDDVAEIWNAGRSTEAARVGIIETRARLSDRKRRRRDQHHAHHGV
jgi:hypothetical protein